MTTPTDPEAIGTELARLERERAAEHQAVDAKYRGRMVELRAAFARARLQRSAA